MSVRFFQSATSRPNLEWENSPIIRSQTRPRQRPLFPAIVAAFLVGFAVGVMF